MLEVGLLSTFEEDRTHFGMWAIVSSPLTLGMDIRNDTVVNAALSVLGNTEVLAVNQGWAGSSGVLVSSNSTS
jgi:alpha-galactosidase